MRPSAGEWRALATTRVRGVVARFDARSPREIASRDQFLVELDRLVDPFDRHGDRVHVTASAIVLGRRGTLLHVHKRAGRWMQPGGHVDPGELPEDAAVRETLEETGLDATHPLGEPIVIHLDVHPAGEHLHLDLRYLLLAPDIEARPPAGESQEVRWFTIDEALALVDETLADGLRRAFDSRWRAPSRTASATRAPDGAPGKVQQPARPPRRSHVLPH